MTDVYANPDRWAVTLNGYDNGLPLHVGLLPDGKDYFSLAAGWAVDGVELIGDQYRESPWRVWVVRNMMVLPGPDYQVSGSARYWENPAKVQAEVDEIAAEMGGPVAELHVPLGLLRSAKPFIPKPTAPTPPARSVSTPDPRLVPPAKLRQKHWYGW